MLSEPLRHSALDAALAAGLLPDAVLGVGSKIGVEMLSRGLLRGGAEAQERRLQALLARLRSGPVADALDVANAQHASLSAEFFELVLGPRLKYSGCLWPPGAGGLADAEDAMLELTCERAEVRDGMRVLDLWCGWGALSLWIAERYPNARVVALANSAAQRQYVATRGETMGLTNLTVTRADMNGYSAEVPFDRILSIEMFEHMRNWAELLRRISMWLRPDGRLFMQLFTHRCAPYLLEETSPSARLFSAGLMPSHDLPLMFQENLKIEHRWAVSGVHYARTLQAWLGQLDANHTDLLAVLRRSGRTRGEARQMLASWRLFLIAAAATWASSDGGRWLVSHYLFASREEGGVTPDVLWR
ncbi:MAG: SAM-dependent methyltransferase [Solirubrobacteraceae bacterium]